MVVVLAGGMGAARFIRGLVRVVPPEHVVVVGNTADDIDVYGVHVSPDLDIVTFMLAGILDEQRQFGIVGDTHAVMQTLRALGEEPWFALGDRDYATCLARTQWERGGARPSECARRIAAALGVAVRILPMTDERVETRVTVRGERGVEDLHFQEYWVRRRAADPAAGVRVEGIERARPAPGVLDAISEAEAVLVAPSNPVVSVGPILGVAGVREALRETRAPVVGVSPIVAGAVVRGMADKLLAAAGVAVSAAGVAGLYRDFLDGFVIDDRDAALLPEIEAMGVRAATTQTLMHTPEDAAKLAKGALALAGEARG